MWQLRAQGQRHIRGQEELFLLCAAHLCSCINSL
jgi:hypothetical protein